MIVRILAIDPNPEPGRSDLLVYQVPENSREFKTLTALMTAANIEWESLAAPQKAGVTVEHIRTQLNELLSMRETCCTTPEEIDEYDRLITNCRKRLSRRLKREGDHT